MSDKYKKDIGTSDASYADDAGLVYTASLSSLAVSKSNFSFLQNYDPIFYQLATVAEDVLHLDPNTTLVKLRQLSEALAKDIATRLTIPSYRYNNQNDLIFEIDRKLNLSPDVKSLFHVLRKRGNKAVHEFTATQYNAIESLKIAYQLALWYHRTFGEDEAYEAEPFVTPAVSLISSQQTREEYEKLLAEKEKEIDLIKEVFETKLKQLSEVSITDKESAQLQKTYKQKARKASSKISLSEDDTRRIIDLKLIEAGWEADTKELDYRKGARPQEGTCRAIAEWECYNPHTDSKTRADYVLFIGLKPVAVVEAKRFGNDVADDIRQAEEYSRDINLESVKQIASDEGVEIFLDEWYISTEQKETYRVPLAFSTNGRDYQNQLKTKSGIWFRDLRKPANKSRALVHWYTPDEIEKLLARDESKIIEKLQEDHWGSLELRDYQKEAVHKAEEAIIKKQRELLLAMATGTGKTRTVIALMYRLLKAGVFNRILFLVDRGALGEQAQNTFADIRPEGNYTFEDIYDIKKLTDKFPNTKTKVHVATVQSMVKRVLASDDMVPIGRYDCIIVDEAHRGYTLDKEMTEGEIELHDFNEYISAYRQVLDYFDATRIGLTATPAKHTVEIFGKPVYTYTYREAVIDGWLVDSEPPYNFDTQLSKNGIHFKKDEAVDVVNMLGETRTELLEDELDFEVEDFNRKVLNEDFNRVICETLARDYLDPMSGEKTLIFCVNDIHADIVVAQMKLALDKYHGDQADKTVMKITGAVRNPRGAILEYKNERLPNIAVTVDLLTTGIDVPPIVNLVFLRRVRSRILYEQMKGRATRLCPEIDKDVFRIFDAVGLYKVLEKVDTMKPIVQQVSTSFTQLIDDLNNEASYQLSGEAYGEAGDKTHAQNVHDQLIAKLQRIVRRTQKIEKFPEAKEPLELLDTLMQEKLSCNFSELPKKLKEMTPQEVGAFFKEHPQILDFMVDLREGLRINANDLLISTHEDELISVNRGFGKDEEGNEIEAPEDYLESFNQFIKENVNKIAALTAVVTRPRDLTREDLKSLRLMLSEHNFSETHLHAAWKEAKNEDIAATIIGYIRSSALGSPLIPFEQRVDNALTRIKASQKWSQNQQRWLDRLAKQLKKNIILDNEAFESSPFRESGGRERIENFFDGKLDTILDDFSTYMWEESA